MVTYIKKAVPVIGMLALFFFAAPVATAAEATPWSFTTEATCAEAQFKWCKTSSGGGWCTNTTSTCPLVCSSGQMSCWDSTTNKEYCHTGTTCPMTCGSGMIKCNENGGDYCYSGTTCPAACAAGQMKCWDSSGKQYCHTGTSCPVTCSQGMMKCKTESGSEYCSTSCPTACPSGQTKCWDSTGKEYCHDGTSCPVTCSSGMIKCKSDGNSNSEYCYAGTTCPTSCSSGQVKCWENGKEYCKDGTSCSTTTSDPYQYKTKTTCETAAYKWCKGYTETSSYCTYATTTCPANDEATCSEQKGKWCPPSQGSMYGWCTWGGSCGSTATWSWPDTETECKKYKGEWCASSENMMKCRMAGESCSTVSWCWTKMTNNYCPPMPTTKDECSKNNLYWCDEKSASGSWSTCRMNPCTKTECLAKGKYWCDSSTAGSTASAAWCSDKKCYNAAPSGSMICPDGENYYKTSYTECPIEEKTMVCPDGKRIVLGTPCPTPIKIKTCTDGSTVGEGEICPIKDDKQFTKEDEQKVEKIKKEYLEVLSQLEAFFAGAKDDTSLSKISEMRASLNALVMDKTAWDVLDLVKGNITALKYLKEDVMKEKSVKDDVIRDEEAQEKALIELKQYTRELLVHVNRAQQLIDRAQARKVSVPESLEKSVREVKASVDKLLTTTEYNVASGIKDELMLLLDDIEPYRSYLESLPVLPIILPQIERRVQGAEVRIKSATSVATRIKYPEVAKEMKTVLEGVKSDVARLKTGDIGDVEVDDFIENQIYEPMMALYDNADDLNLLLGVKTFITRATQKSSTYTTRLKNAKTKKSLGDVKVKELLDINEVFKNKVAELKKLSATPMKGDKLKKAFELIDTISDMTTKMEEVLKIKQESLFRREANSFRKRLDKERKLDFEGFDEVAESTEETAYFFRKNFYDRALALQAPLNRTLATAR